MYNKCQLNSTMKPVPEEYSDIPSDCRQPYGISVLEQFMGLADYAEKIEAYTKQKLHKIASDQQERLQICTESITPYPEYFRQLKESYNIIYNAILSIENTIDNVEL